MAESFKNMFDKPFFGRFVNDLSLVLQNMSVDKFVTLVMDEEWENRGYKQRIAHITTVLHKFMPTEYKEAVAKIFKLLDCVKVRLLDFSKIDDKNFNLLTLEYGVILDHYVERYGIEDYETSVKAIERITQFTTCEFVTHAFIVKYQDEMMKQMLAWSKHPHWGVRRLASEGCRPRLPWAMSLPKLKENPAPIIPIMENLKNDPSRFVRLSVANNLNDISKDNPQIVIALAKKWKGQSENIDWVIKHGCRTLLKQGNHEILNLFGLSLNDNISIGDFKILTKRIKMGDSIEFCFNLNNYNTEKRTIRLEYGIYYRKMNGEMTRKVYKISEKEYKGNSITEVNRKHSFRPITTRTFYPGIHQIAVIFNGCESGKCEFELVE